MLEEKVKKTPIQSRRRGSELKEAIYKAAINILENEGYEKVTFQNVAKEAKTTRSVLYRYWYDVFDLIFHKILNGVGMSLIKKSIKEAYGKI